MIANKLFKEYLEKIEAKVGTKTLAYVSLAHIHTFSPRAHTHCTYTPHFLTAHAHLTSSLHIYIHTSLPHCTHCTHPTHIHTSLAHYKHTLTPHYTHFVACQQKSCPRTRGAGPATDIQVQPPSSQDQEGG